MQRIFILVAGLMLAATAGAKFPPPTEEAKAKAAEAKDKAAWSDKVAAYQLCVAQDKVAAYYRKTRQVEVKPLPVAVPAAAPSAVATPAVLAAPAAPVLAIPACQDPGPYTAAQAATKIGVADAMPVPAAGKPGLPVNAKK